MSPILETTRLKLRPGQLADLDMLHRLWIHPQIRYYLFDNRVISVEEAHSFITDSLFNFEQYGYGLWLIFLRETHQVGGFAGCLSSEEKVPQLIYGIEPNLWGKGYATEASAVILHYVLAELAYPTVKADVDEPNLASIQILKKLGMQQTKRTVIQGYPLLYFEVKAQNFKRH